MKNKRQRGYQKHSSNMITKKMAILLLSTTCICAVQNTNRAHAQTGTITINADQYPYNASTNVGSDGTNGAAGTAAYIFITTLGSLPEDNGVIVDSSADIQGGSSSGSGVAGAGIIGGTLNVTNSGTISGGAGTNSGISGTGTGGIGINGNETTITNLSDGSISGGNGNSTSTGYATGIGGAGISGDTYNINNSGSITGGGGAGDRASGSGISIGTGDGRGGTGISGNNSTITNNSGGSISGGDGTGTSAGQGSGTGRGGAGISGDTHIITNSGAITGGTGTGTGTDFVYGDGRGGTGISGNNSTITNNSGGTISGGGGTGISAGANYNSGTGGAGISGNTLTITNSSIISGGNGTGTGTSRINGNGGAGIQADNSTITNLSGGSISGGTGTGTDGAGISGSNLTITNSGSISGGAGDFNGAAISLAGGVNILTLQEGSDINGDVVLETSSPNTLSIISTDATTIKGNLTAKADTSVILSGEIVTLTGDATFAENTTLSFDSLFGGEALSAKTIVFNNTNIKFSANDTNITSITNWNQNDYTLATTTDGVSGTFDAKTGNTLLTDGAKDYAGIIITNNGYDLAYGLKWNEFGNDAYGTFDLKQDAVLTLGVNLADNTNVTANNQNEWDGKSLTKDGLGTLILSVSNTYTGDTTVAGGTLKTGIVDAFANTSGVTVNAGATLSLGGHNQQLGSNATLNNAGTVLINDWDAALLTAPVKMSGGIINSGTVVINNCTTCAGQTLEVDGDWDGQNGTVSIGAVLGGDSSLTDTLVITGNATGTTFVKVTNEDGLGAQTIGGIKVIEVVGTSSDAFKLSGDYVHEGDQAVVAGAYAYKLYHGTISVPDEGDWYLRSQLKEKIPLYQAGVSAYEAYPQALLGLNGLNTLQQRIGNRFWADAGNKVISQGADAIQPYAALQEAGGHVDGNGIWGRIEGAHNNIEPRFSSSDTSYNQNILKLQAGMDGLLSENESGSFIGGVFVQYAHGKTKTKSAHGDGEISSNGYGFGGTLTWYGNEGFYVDGQAQATWYRSDLSSNLANVGIVNGNHGFGYALSMETGKRFTINTEWSVTPQAQLVYSHVKFNDFNDVWETPVSIDKSANLQSRLGLTLDHETSWQNASGMLNRSHVYGLANLYYEFLDGTRVDVAGTSFASKQDRVWGGVGLGGSYNWNDDMYSIYGEGIIKTSLNNFGDSHSLQGNVGFRVKW